MSRSRAYPVVSLEEAVEACLLVEKNLGRGEHDRESLAVAMGYNGAHGFAARKVAALVHYGLLTASSGGSYELTELAKRVLYATSDAEREEALATSFGSPTLFSELLSKFVPQGRVPEQLSNILVRDHGITAKASTFAADTFLTSGQFAQRIGQDRRLTGGRAEPRLPPSRESSPVGESSVPRSPMPAHREVVGAVTIRDAASFLPEHPGPRQQTFNVTLSSGFGQVIVPVGLTRRDIDKLTSIVALLALDAEDGP